MNLITEPYLVQKQRWPTAGRQILAQYDANTVVVYQAYRAEIGHFAAQHGYFGGPFRLNRMSWVKPNFLWMMYRSGWGTKPEQAVTLAVRLRRDAFDTLLADAVHSSFTPDVYRSVEEWGQAVARSSVRLQWDPDHAPSGEPLKRRALQLGLRGRALEKYARDWIVQIEDVSPFVHEQRRHVEARNDAELLTPREDVYPVSQRIWRNVCGSVWPARRYRTVQHERPT